MPRGRPVTSPAPEPAKGSAANGAATPAEAPVGSVGAAPGPVPPPETPASPALDLGLALALATALIYTAGWAYAYRWFARFDIGLNALELPAETLLMYGFWTLRAHSVLLLAYGLGLALWVWHGPRVRLWLLRTAPFWLLAAFGLAYAAGGASADSRFAQHSAAGFGCFPQARVGLIPQSGRAAALDALAADLAEREYRLLAQTPNLLLLIKPMPQGAPVVALVPRENVDVLRLASTEGECRP
jgi:hypothetical protein